MDTASDRPGICPFLRAIDDDVSLRDPILRPDQANRCTALGDAAPQSLRQQENACLTSAHVNCPRFVRGALLFAEPTPASRGTGLQLTPAVLGALLVLAGSFALSVGFVVANGGMDLPGSAVGSPQALLEPVAPSPNASQDPGPAGSVSGASPSATGPEASAGPNVASATSAPSTAATLEPTVAPTPAPSSDRYALLKPCPDAPDCWIYAVRSGDNLVSIAHYFGVPFKDVTDLNPWTKTTQLVAGQELRLSQPTR